MNMLTIISRKSVLAKIQATEVSEVIKKRFPEIKINFKTKDTSGDIDLTTPLHKMPEMPILLFIPGKIYQLILKKERKELQQ